MTQIELNELFEYQDGCLYWKKKINVTGIDRTGKVAGCRQRNGYWIIKIHQKIWLAHRLIFMWHHGYFPETIDHIDRDNSNNRIENLRAATYGQNNANRKMQKNNACGLKGVWFRKDRGKWISRVGHGKARKHVGSFRTKEDAHEAYKKAAVIAYGKFANV
jgi:hypothetical protein